MYGLVSKAIADLVTTGFVVGMVQGLGKLYKTPASVGIAARKTAGADHDIFDIHWTLTTA